MWSVLASLYPSKKDAQLVIYYVQHIYKHKRGNGQGKCQNKNGGKMHTNDLKQFIQNKGTLIRYILQLKHGSIHANAMRDVNHFLSEGYDEESFEKKSPFTGGNIENGGRNRFRRQF